MVLHRDGTPILLLLRYSMELRYKELYQNQHHTEQDRLKLYNSVISMESEIKQIKGSIIMNEKLTK